MVEKKKKKKPLQKFTKIYKKSFEVNGIRIHLQNTLRNLRQNYDFLMLLKMIKEHL